MNQFDSYMLNKVRRLKDLRTRSSAEGQETWPPSGEGSLEGLEPLMYKRIVR